MFSQTIADDEVEDPRKTLNLSPFEKWRSVGECLRNVMILELFSVVFSSKGVRSIFGG